MRRDVHEIPPAPRRVRWRGVLAHRWPLALAGALFAVYGGLWTFMLFSWSQVMQRDDALLDARAATAPGRVLEVVPRGQAIDGGEVDLVRYEFWPGGRERPATLGCCVMPGGETAVRAEVVVEHLPGRPEASRIAGGRLQLIGDTVTPALRFVVLPGVLLLLGYAGSALLHRRLLRHGDVAVATVDSARPVRWVLPEMLAVSYHFRDRRAQPRSGRHWVRARSALGAQLREGGREFAVIHDRRRPRRSRLVIPAQCRARPGTAAIDGAGSRR